MKVKAKASGDSDIRPSLRPLAAVVHDERVDEVVGLQADYDRHLPAALKLAKALVKNFVGDANLAYHNVCAGLDAVKREHARLLADGVPVAWDRLEELPSLALALCYAASRVQQVSAGDGAVSTKLAEARVLRDILLTNAEGAELLGLIPAGSVKKVREAEVTRDRYGDLAALAALFQKHADALKGQTPVKVRHVRDALALHAELTRALMPKGTPTSARRSPALVAAIDARNALAALLAQRHHELDKVGGWLWGRDVVEHVPSLQARRAARKPRKKTSAGNPSAPTA